jgi:hypothetical protein
MIQTKYSTRRLNMLSFLKKIFGAKPAEPVPYKVETPAKVSEFPFPTAKPDATPKAQKKTTDKKPVAKKPVARKPKAPKA